MPTTVVVDTVRRDPQLDIAIGPAWLRQVVADGADAVLRLYRPAPTVAFSGKDALRPGIGAAVRAAQRHGYAAVRRGPGGHAAAYHPGCLGIDHLSVGELKPDSITGRFTEFGALLAGALQSLGVPAGVGEVPGEYCPGEFSVHDGAGHKLIGTAQRLIPGGWLFSSMIVVTGAAELAEVLTDVYRDLDLPLIPSTVGAVDGSAPGCTVDDVQEAVLRAFAEHDDLTVGGPVPAAVLTAAATARDRHRLPD